MTPATIAEEVQVPKTQDVSETSNSMGITAERTAHMTDERDPTNNDTHTLSRVGLTPGDLSNRGMEN